MLFAVCAFAVPARPGTGIEGAAAHCRSHTESNLLTLQELQKDAVRAGGASRAPQLTPATQDLPLVVIVIGFQNQPYLEDYDWASEIFEGDKSLAAYYTDMSFGNFTFVPAAESSAYQTDGNLNAADAANDGIIHVTLADTDHDDWSLEYGYDPGLATEKQMYQSFLQAMKKATEASAAYIDYASFDRDNDGTISTDELAVAYVVAGYEAAATMNFPEGRDAYLWSHAWSFTDAAGEYGFTPDLPSAGGTAVDSFIAIAEMLEAGEIEPISVLAHELGHYLGLPDLYDTTTYGLGSWSSYEVSFFSLMSDGSWGIDPVTNETIPFSMDIWSRSVLGWCEPGVAEDSGSYYVFAQDYTSNSSNGRALRIPTERENEYYLLENRQFRKWDAGLGSFCSQDHGGIILWHIDDSVYDEYEHDNEINNHTHRPAVIPLYPEVSGDVYSFTGKGTVLSAKPFYDASVWNDTFTALGDSLYLPLYGTGDSADTRDARTLSVASVRFLTDSDTAMEVMIHSAKHDLQKYDAVAATCTEDGSSEYYYCDVCGKYFSDAQGVNEIDAGDWVIHALGHTEPDANGFCERCHEQIAEPTPVTPVPKDLCPYCQQEHTGFFGRFIAFFHRILYFFKQLFG